MVGTSNRSGWSEGEEEKKNKKSKSIPRLLLFLSCSLSCLRLLCARLSLLLVGGTYSPSMHEVQVEDRASPLVSSAGASSSLLLLVLSAGVNQLYLVTRSRYLEIRPKALVCNLSALAWWLRTEASVLHAHYYYQILHVSACSCIQPRYTTQ